MIHGVWRSVMNVPGWAEGSLALLLMLSGCRRSDPLQENWGKIYGGMDKTNVVALLGYPKRIIRGESPCEEDWFYCPKNIIYYYDPEKSDLVVNRCVVMFVSNKTVNTYISLAPKNQRRER